jgi:hypothetical protein
LSACRLLYSLSVVLSDCRLCIAAAACARCVNAPPPCDTKSRSFQPGCALALAQGVTIEDDMVTDAALWFLLAGMIGFIACGCYYTRYTRLTANRYRPRHE